MGVNALTKRLGEIRRHKRLRGGTWIAYLEALVQRHEQFCRSPDWTKENGQFAKGLDNWLAVTRERYDQEPPEAMDEEPRRKNVKPELILSKVAEFPK